MSSRVPRRLRLLAALSASGLLLAAGVAQAEPSVTTYPLPTGLKSGSGIVTDAAGKVWFGADDVFTPTAATPRLVRFDVAQAGGAELGVTTYPTPTFVGAPQGSTRITGLAFDTTRGRLWLVRNDSLFGFVTPSELTPGSSTSGFVVDHLPTPVAIDSVALDTATDGVWITENTTTNVAAPLGSGYFPGARAARISVAPGPPASLQVIESKNIAQQNGETTLGIRYDAKPSGVVSDGQGGAWFGESDAGNPGWRIAHAVGTGYTEFQLPCVPSPGTCSGSTAGTGGPNSLAMAPDGAVWFTVPLTKSIGRFDGGSFTIFPLTGISPTLATGNPVQIRSAPDGTLWLAVNGGAPGAASNAIVRIVPTAAPTATVYPVTAGRPNSVTGSATGDVWFTLSANNGAGLIGRIADALATTPPPAGGDTQAPGAATPAPVAPAATPAPGAIVLKGSTSVAQPARVTSTGDTATVDQQCVGPPSDPCSLVFIISAQEYVRGFPGSRPRSGRLTAAPAPKTPVVLGQLSVTLNGGEKRKIKLRLGKKARKALAVQGSIKTKLTVTQTQPDGTSKVISTKKLTFKRKR